VIVTSGVGVGTGVAVGVGVGVGFGVDVGAAVGMGVGSGVGSGVSTAVTSGVGEGVGAAADARYRPDGSRRTMSMAYPATNATSTRMIATTRPVVRVNLYICITSIRIINIF